MAYRLGYLKGGANDVMTHAWFGRSGFDWGGLVNLTLAPPWRPTLSACDDTTNFDDAGAGDSLDGPGGKSFPSELEAKWMTVRNEYAAEPNGLDDCAHLC